MLSRALYTKIGSDPELFLTQNGKVIGCEKAIPEAGITGDSYYTSSKVVRDGVQLELHPLATYDCTTSLRNMGNIFARLGQKLKEYPGMEVSFAGVVEVSKIELASLSEKSRVLGCKPSLNYYGIKPLEVDPIKYRKRSAGGHIHFGLDQLILDDRLRLIPIFDVGLGNTGVLLDRDPMQAERRKLYGRAGEYRLPTYGIEYRTLSNFWLKSPILAEFMFLMARELVNVLNTTIKDGVDLEREMLQNVDFQKLIKGIQTNDVNLALDTWTIFKGFIVKHFDMNSPIPPNLLPNFERFVDGVIKEGLSKYFSIDPMAAWRGSPQHGGWITFLRGV